MPKPGGTRKVVALQTYSVSVAKDRLPELRRAAALGSEILIKDTRSGQQEPVSLLSTRLVDELVDRSFPLSVTVLDQPGDALVDSQANPVGATREWSLLIPELAITGIGESRETAEDSLIRAVTDYAVDFFSDPTFYLNDKSGRQHHWGYLRRVLRCEGDIGRLRSLLGL